MNRPLEAQRPGTKGGACHVEKAFQLEGIQTLQLEDGLSVARKAPRQDTEHVEVQGISHTDHHQDDHPAELGSYPREKR